MLILIISSGRVGNALNSGLLRRILAFFYKHYGKVNKRFKTIIKYC